MDFGARSLARHKEDGYCRLRRYEGMPSHLGPLVCAPVNTRAAHRTTNSSCANPQRKQDLVGQSQPGDGAGALLDALKRDSSPICKAKISSSDQCYAGADERIACPSAWSPSFASQSLARNMFMREAETRSWRHHRSSPSSTPRFQANPETTARAPRCSWCCTSARSSCSSAAPSYAGEIKKSIFTRAELPAAAAGRAADALLGQRRPGRRRGALLRPLRHRQDDALGRPRPRRSSATTSTAGATAACSTSRAAATPR